MENSTFLTSEYEKEQMEALKDTMRVFFNGDLEYSKRFSFYSHDFSRDEDIKKILKNFEGYYGMKDVEELKYDIRLMALNEENKLVFMYDSKNKFTPQRQKVLESYPSDLKFGFPVSTWIEKCKKIHADSAVAIQDAMTGALVDLTMTKKGYKVIRIMYDAYDWTNQHAIDWLQQMIIEANRKNV